jgi:LmbE family N-acetylglucosaminyl deacetylase
VVEAVRFYRPRVILVSYPSCAHPDHVEASHLVTRSWFLSRLARVETASGPHWPERVAYFMSRHVFEPSFVVDVTDTWDRKVRAIAAYGSQLYREDGNESLPRTEIAAPEFMDRIENRARTYGLRIGVRYGEPFWLREPLALGDPTEALAGIGR